jgi:hypothetical protein
MNMSISQKTAQQLLDALIEASALFDNYPELYKQIGTYQVVTEAIGKGIEESDLYC